MTVTLVLYTGFWIGSLLFILGTVLVAELINQILCELPTFDVYLYFPAVVTIDTSFTNSQRVTCGGCFRRSFTFGRRTPLPKVSVMDGVVINSVLVSGGAL